MTKQIGDLQLNETLDGPLIRRFGIEALQNHREDSLGHP
jgi:hypothetical protein